MFNPLDLAFALIGVGMFLAAILPRLIAKRAISTPIIFLGLGILVHLLPLGLVNPDPRVHPNVAKHVAEIVVIIALMGAGLRLDRPFGRFRWSSTWRLLAVTMPLSIVATAVLGWWALGLAPASAILLGSVLAPTDPVLASDVQVGEPSEDEESEDEVRFALTSEAGLNDGLAFPFTYAAIAIAVKGGAPGNWLGHWLLVDVGYRIVAGVAIGWGVGWLLGRLFFRSPSERFRLAEHAEGFVALAATFLAYGAGQLVHGYGFLSVFVCACMIRAAERTHGYHKVLHDFTEQVERLLTVGVLVLFGGAIVEGLLGALTWQAAALGLFLVFCVRPTFARLALLHGRGTTQERRVIAFFGIRGIGSLFYLTYALGEASFPEADLLWATVGFVIVVSVLLHGITATPLMRRLDRNRELSSEPRHTEPPAYAETGPGT
ncbi:MAG TPA: sodium:proton antiporter [Frankiaceae bacterium]|nr:sodium:proton antiporter [Frankiaceae bacterium]